MTKLTSAAGRTTKRAETIAALDVGSFFLDSVKGRAVVVAGKMTRQNDFYVRRIDDVRIEGDERRFLVSRLNEIDGVQARRTTLRASTLPARLDRLLLTPEQAKILASEKQHVLAGRFSWLSDGSMKFAAADDGYMVSTLEMAIETRSTPETAPTTTDDAKAATAVVDALRDVLTKINDAQTVLKNEVSSLRGDVAALKQEMATLRRSNVIIKRLRKEDGESPTTKPIGSSLAGEVEAFRKRRNIAPIMTQTTYHTSTAK